jgi:hypothetical protein
VLSSDRINAVDYGSKRVRRNMLLATFCRFDPVVADPERESDKGNRALIHFLTLVNGLARLELAT